MFVSGSPESPEIPSETIDPTVRYDIVLYGGRYMDDLETLIVLDIAGDKYEFIPYLPKSDYTIVKNQSAEQALAYARDVYTSQSAYQRTRVSRIVDKENRLIGYELRPLYKSFRYGYSDIMFVNYVFQGDKVIIHLKLIDPVERREKYRMFDGFHSR
ncbi:MAG: hypothetical protein LLF86_02670 [Nitrospiraceae bacterium]|nr:hypothetical protein [Nitrospiraceae bacterium]